MGTVVRSSTAPARWALIAVALGAGLSAGCLDEPRNVETFEISARRDSSAAWQPIGELPVLGSGDRLEFRAVLPAELSGPAPGIFVAGPPSHIGGVHIGDRIAAADPPGSGAFALREGDAGALVTGVIEREPWLTPHVLQVGSIGSVLWFKLDANLLSFSIGVALFIVGLALTLASLRGQRAAQRWMGIFAASAGVTQLAQLWYLQGVFPLPPRAWTVAHTIGLAVFPAALARMWIVLFGDTRHRLLERLSLAMFAFLGLELVLSIADVVPLLALKRFTYVGMIALAVPGIGVLLRRAREGMVPAAMTLVGLGLLLAGGAVPVLQGLELLPQSNTQAASLAILALVVAQGLAVRRSYEDKATALASSEVQLTLRVAELERNKTEIEGLNEELRDQVRRRTREISAVLASAPGGLGRELQPGEVVEGRYRVEQRLGAGAMGVVYEVERRSDGKRYALKAMGGKVAGDAATRFAREAEIAAGVSHENLVGIIDVGVAEAGWLYFVMELVRGASLDQARDRVASRPVALSILAQVARGLAALHAQGVVHRDVKPANILLHEGHDGAPRAKLADLGIARRDEAPLTFAETLPASIASDETAHPLARTPTGAWIGTPLYMAPELARGEPARAPADVFALGIVASELLLHRYPFAMPPFLAELAKRPIVADLGGLEDELRDLVAATLDRDPARRPTSAELAEAFGSTSA